MIYEKGSGLYLQNTKLVGLGKVITFGFVIMIIKKSCAMYLNLHVEIPLL